MSTPSKIGRYTLRKDLGKGGMGEVFLAYDPLCEREIALKKIRAEFTKNPVIRARFLREAQLAAQLSHPGIIPIHAIEYDGENSPYYTMSYIRGETLRQILHQSRLEEKAGKILHPTGSSIPILLRIFLNACHAVAYSHSRGILHRDLKPENILVGTFGETIIVDWGLAEYEDQAGTEDFEQIPDEADPGLTRPGKVVGTLAYISPERAMYEPASIQSDIYSLGVILYQILTLRTPFNRRDIKTFRKLMSYEQLILPLEIAPYRDIPTELSDIAAACLAPNKSERIADVPTLIQRIEDYLKGVPQWMHAKRLSVNNPGDWRLLENILLSKHQALTNTPEKMEWVLMMVSKSVFWGNLHIETHSLSETENREVEILFGVPQTHIQNKQIQGWSVKIVGKKIALLRDQIEIVSSLSQTIPQQIAIELTREYLHVVTDGKLILEHTPPDLIHGNHIGLLLRDGECTISMLDVFVGSCNSMVNCLAIPEAFLAKGRIKEALEEYKRIAHGLQGRTEGWQALFRAGSLLVILANREGQRERKRSLFDSAFQQFDTLGHTPAAPLEYLGKALIYKALNEEEEEAKCLELALRKAHLHPLSMYCANHLLFRLHEAAYQSKYSTYSIALICLRLIPDLLTPAIHQELLTSISKNLETPACLVQNKLIVKLAFWLGNIPILEEYGASAAIAVLTHEIPFSQEETLLQKGDFAAAARAFSTYPEELLKDETGPLFVPYGCFLRHTAGKEAAMSHFFENVSMAGPIFTTSLLAHFLLGKAETKIAPFLWQKMQLLKQRALYAYCSHSPQRAVALMQKLKTLIENHRK
jgi:serine/threonine-protein kinase